jgi:PAS domain S-box-containing protein
MRIESAKITARKHVHINGLGSRIALLAVFSAFSIAGIGIATALDMRQAVIRDAEAAAQRLAPVVQLASRGFIDDAKHALDEISPAAAGGKNCTANATDILKRNANVLAVGFATPTGVVTCSASQGMLLVTGRDFLRRTLASRTFAMGDYTYEAGLGKPTLGFAQPVMAGNDVAGVAFVIVSVNDLAQAETLESLPSGAVFGIIDARTVSILRGPEKDKWVGKELPESDLSVEIMSRKTGSVTLSGEDGVSRLYAFVPLAGIGSPSGYVYVGIPSDLAFTAVRNAAYRSGAIAFPLGVLALWASLTLGDLLILRRIRKLVDAMRSVAVGDGGSSDDVPGGMGELDELTTIFERMHGKLIDTMSNTDQKVLTRTADLEFGKGMAELEKARTEALIASIGEGVVATDKEGRIIFINQEAERATGWIAPELVGKKEQDVIQFLDADGKLIDPELRPARIALKTGERSVLAAFPKPYSLVCKDGTKFPVNVTVSPVAFGKDIIGAIEVIRDITDEAEFDKRKTEFISIASHQLRTPLAATKWLTDMLRKGDLGALQPKQQEMVDKLFIANERMVVLVNELLNVSRLESGVAKPSPTPTNLVEMIDSVITEALPLLAAKKQTAVFDKKPQSNAMIDAFLMREVVANLVSNASKYSKDGGAVTVAIEQRGNELVVSIKDDGIGIPKADQNQLFKKFFRAGNALKSAVQGTGLGLYFVKSVVEMSGGKIWFTSEEQKGTTFFFTVPVAVAAPDQKV